MIVFGMVDTFERPWLLPLLALPALLLAWIWRGAQRPVALPLDHGVRADRRVLRSLLMFAECLPALLLAVAILQLCVPLATGSPVTQRKLTNIEFCVDCSGSMTAAFGEGTRYDASMAAIREFLDFREGDAFGLTFFASDVVRWCPLTRDTSAFACALPFMKPDSQRAIGGGTMIGRALINCRRVLEEQASGDRMIILVSDGQSSDLLNGANEERARELQQAGITLFCIHIGDPNIPDEIVTMARLTGGEAFVSGDPAALQSVFQRIDGMKPAEIEQVAVEYVDEFRPFCAGGMVLVLLWLLASYGLRYVPW